MLRCRGPCLKGSVCSLQGLKPRQLAILFRNNHFNTLFKFEDALYLLVTDQGYLHEQARPRPARCHDPSFKEVARQGCAVQLPVAFLAILPNSSSCSIFASFLLQDVVWEKLDAIDGNTVYVGSRIHKPGILRC